MTDVFFSYSSKDRERIRLFHDALAKQGFDVFWDIQVPAGTNWNNWIKARLDQSRCVIVFWTTHSASSDNVMHEVAIARDQGKLLQVLLDPLTTRELPMGTVMEQAVQLSGWDGAGSSAEWDKLIAAVQDKATPVWLQYKLASLERQLRAARKQIEEADAKIRALETEQENETRALGDLRRAHDKLAEEREKLKSTIAGLETVIETERKAHAAAMTGTGEQAASKVRELQFAFDQKASAYSALLGKFEHLTVEHDRLVADAQTMTTRVERKHADAMLVKSKLLEAVTDQLAAIQKNRDTLEGEHAALRTELADLKNKLMVETAARQNSASGSFFGLAILASILSCLPDYLGHYNLIPFETYHMLKRNQHLIFIATGCLFLLSLVTNKNSVGNAWVGGIIFIALPIGAYLANNSFNPFWLMLCAAMVVFQFIGILAAFCDPDIFKVIPATEQPAPAKP